MRIALAQVNPTVGDLRGNAARIREAAAAAPGADLVVLPELALCGYTPRDLLEEPGFARACEAELDALRDDRSLPPLLLGAPVISTEPGKPLRNAAVLLRGGRRSVVAKSLLPEYDVFEERRWFAPAGAAGIVEHLGIPLGVSICEDMWTGPLYTRDPVAEAARAGARILVNLSASPYERGKPAARRTVAAAHARAHGLPFLVCNTVGANDQVLFDGNSFALDARGALACRLAPFREEVRLVDLAASAAPDPGEDDLRAALAMGIADYFRKTGFRDALLGLSGGVDSALVACLAADALGADRVTGIAMPGPFSAPCSLEDAETLARSLGIRFETVPIVGAYERLLGDLRAAWGDRPFDVAEENLQARIRGMVLMSFANKFGALLLGTSNKSEFAMGYCTLYGDMCGALAPLADVYKTGVYGLARAYGGVIPPRTIARAPSAELRPDQTDQDTLPPYETLDAILALHLEERQGADAIVGAGFDPATVRRVLRAVSIAEYKRQQGPVVLKVSRKALGAGRRYPIVERWRGGVGG